MHLYVGLDVSLDETSICIVDANGKVCKETKAISDPDALFGVLSAFRERIARVGLEAGGLSSWLHTELTALGLPMIVVEATHMRSAIRPRGTRLTATTPKASLT